MRVFGCSCGRGGLFFFFFKQKTAYEMRISDWSSDVCSSDLTLKRLMGGANFASRRWIWEQYDSLVRGHTLRGSGGDAAVVRLPGTTREIGRASCRERVCQYV